jgi:hypothetical protein
MGNGADLQYTIGLDPGSTGKVIDSIRDKLLGLGTIAFGGALLARGFAFNQTMYDGERAVRAIVQQFQGLNEAAAKPIAAAAMQKLVDLEPKVAGSLTDIVNGFVSTAAASAGVGMTIDQNIDLVGKFANALSKMKMPVDQVGQELRSILTGNIGADSALAKALTITPEMVESAKKAGTLYEMVTSKIGLLGEAGDNAATAFSSLSSSIDKAAGALSTGLFETALKGSSTLTSEINKNQEAFTNLGAAIGMFGREVVKVFSFVNELTNATGRQVAIAGMMITQSMSYGEAAKVIDAVTEARKREAAAAEVEAAAVKKTGDAAMEAAALKSKAAKEAASATAKAGLTNDPAAAKKAAKKQDKESGFDADAAAKVFDELIDKQESLDELKRRSAMDEMTTAQKVAAVREQIAEAVAREAALAADVFSPDQGKLLDAEKQRVELQRELNSLQKQQAKDAEDAAKKAQEQAEQSRKERTEKANARNEGMGELAVLREQAAGHDKKAAALEKQLRIEKEKQDIMQKEGATEEDALRRAKEKVSLEDRIAKRKDKGDAGQGRHIGGVTNRRMMGGAQAAPKGGRFDQLQKSAFGSDALSSRGMNSSVKRLGRMMGQTNTASLSGRIATATTEAAPKPPAPTNAQADPAILKLDAILSELTRIRTA